MSKKKYEKKINRMHCNRRHCWMTLFVVVGLITGFPYQEETKNLHSAPWKTKPEPALLSEQKKQETIPLYQVMISLAENVRVATVSLSVRVAAGTVHSEVDPWLMDYFGELHKKDLIPIGSGIMINKEGYLISTEHTLRYTHISNVVVTFEKNEKEYNVSLIGADARMNLAVLKIEGEEAFPYAFLGDSDTVVVGDFVVAVGSPYGLSGSFVTGVVSAVDRNIDYEKKYQSYIQSDVPINPGNAGGALFNLQGEVIAINTSNYIYKSSTTKQTEPSTNIKKRHIGISLAIPINAAKKIITALIDHGTVLRGWMGIAVTEARIYNHGNTHSSVVTEGLRIVRCIQKSPADLAGMQLGDVITHLNNKRIRKMFDFTNEMSLLFVGETVSMKIMQNGDPMKVVSITLKLIEPPE